MDKVKIGVIVFTIILSNILLSFDIISGEFHACVMIAVLLHFVIDFYKYKNKQKQ